MNHPWATKKWQKKRWPSPRVGEAVVLLRNNIGLSQAHLAKRAGVHPSDLSFVETNKRGASKAMMALLEAALGIEGGTIVSEQSRINWSKKS